MFVVMCAVVIYLFLVYRAEITSQGIWATHLVYGLIILTSVLSTLASMARKITVENDWIVQICGSNSDKLASEYHLLYFLEQQPMCLQTKDLISIIF